MHIWRTKELIEKLATEKMSEWEMTQYLIATMVLWSLIGGNVGLFNYDVFGLIVNLNSAVIGALGTYYCFTINRKNDNKNFIVRFTVLSWPVTLRWLIVSILGFIPIIIFYRLSTAAEQSITESWLMDVYMILVEILYFIVMSRYVRIVGESAKKI